MLENILGHSLFVNEYLTNLMDNVAYLQINIIVTIIITVSHNMNHTEELSWKLSINRFLNHLLFAVELK